MKTKNENNEFIRLIRERMKQKKISYQKMAELLGLKSRQAFSYKLFNDTFKRMELIALKKELDL